MIQKNTEHWWVSHVFHQVTLQLVRLLPTPPSHHVGKFRMPPLLARGKQCSALTLGLTQKKKQVVAKGLCHTTAVPCKLTSPLSCMQAWPTLLTDSQECKRGAVEPWKQRKLLRNIPPKEQYAELTARHSFPFPKEQWDLCFFVQASLQHPRLAAEVIHMHVIHNSSPGFMVPFSLKNNTASRISKQGCWWWWLLRTLPRHPPAIDSYCTNTLPQNFR